VKRLWYYYIYLFLVWGSFRYFIQLPVVIEELWFKPVIWLAPLFWWNLSLKDRVEMFSNKRGSLMFGKLGGLWSSLLFGLGMGVLYYVILRRFNFSNVNLVSDTIGVAIATAVTEELVFSGFVAGYLEKINKGDFINFVLVGMMVAMIRLPIVLFLYRLGLIEFLGVMLIAGASGAVNAWLRVKTGNVTGSILARIGMNLATLG